MQFVKRQKKKREAAQRDVAKIGPLGLLSLASLLVLTKKKMMALLFCPFHPSFSIKEFHRD